MTEMFRDFHKYFQVHADIELYNRPRPIPPNSPDNHSVIFDLVFINCQVTEGWLVLKV